MTRAIASSQEHLGVIDLVGFFVDEFQPPTITPGNPLLSYRDPIYKSVCFAGEGGNQVKLTSIVVCKQPFLTPQRLTNPVSMLCIDIEKRSGRQKSKKR